MAARLVFKRIPFSTTQQHHQRRSVSTLILLRHGQSIWNGPNSRFTGWVDVPLTVPGRVEAVAAGQLLRQKGFSAKNVDVAFTSNLQRAHETCELALASMAGPQQDTWESQRIRRLIGLNERHYGAVQGLYKNDPSVEKKYGAEVLQSWRKSMWDKPPPMDEQHEHYQPPPAPLTESLEDCQRRALDCFYEEIAPALFDEEGLPTPPDQRTVVVVAHSNTIRSLMAYFDGVEEDLVPNLHVPNSVPILYRFERSTRKPVSTKLQSAAGGSHARWLVSPENHLHVRKALQPGGMLTRALFEALDRDGKREQLTAAEMEAGLKEFIREEQLTGGGRSDCVVTAVAEKISRELAPDEHISLREFERRATEAYAGLQEADEYQYADQEPFP
jgi:2,3-bisphosphoglycerate-dependent phosphoglycerate mutase